MKGRLSRSVLWRLLLLITLLVAVLRGFWLSGELHAVDLHNSSRMSALMQQARIAVHTLSDFHRTAPVIADSSHVENRSNPPTSGFSVLNNKSVVISNKYQSHGDYFAQSSPMSFTEDEVLQAKKTLRKVVCLQKGMGSIFFYHTRKCAGTTFRNYLTLMAKEWRVRFMEAEGQTMQMGFLTAPGVLTATSLRHPIARIMSLYWYEHVAWYNEVTHEMHKCKPMSVWVDAWADGSPWKQQFQTRNPTSVYVEVQDYFVKSLSGWIGTDGPVNEYTLSLAKQALNQFDIVLLTEDMRLDNTSHWLEEIFRDRYAAGKRLRRRGHHKSFNSLLLRKDNNVDKKEVERLEELLAPDKERVYSRLLKLNKYDMKLWAYAKELVSRRYALASNGFDDEIGVDQGDHCLGEYGGKLSPGLEKYIGIFQPPGHKGPL